MTHTGEQGYVLYIPNEFAVEIYDSIMEAGLILNIKFGGSLFYRNFVNFTKIWDIHISISKYLKCAQYMFSRILNLRFFFLFFKGLQSLGASSLNRTETGKLQFYSQPSKINLTMYSNTETRPVYLPSISILILILSILIFKYGY